MTGLALKGTELRSPPTHGSCGCACIPHLNPTNEERGLGETGCGLSRVLGPNEQQDVGVPDATEKGSSHGREVPQEKPGNPWVLRWIWVGLEKPLRCGRNDQGSVTEGTLPTVPGSAACRLQLRQQGEAGAGHAGEWLLLGCGDL